MQINITALGCRLNEAELESWAQDFQSRGHTLTPDPRNADMLVVNTCAVTHEAVRKSCQLLRRTHRRNPRAKLVVSGCYASLEGEMAASMEGVDLVIGNHYKDQLVDIALRELDLENMSAISTQPGEAPLFARGRNRAFIKIQDGCRHRCTFCIITVARGEERSRPIHEITDEIARLADQGIKEAVLTGVHVGGYGDDRDSGLYQLVEAILNDTDIPRLRLASVEPWDLPENFFDLFQSTRLMPHIHLPLQSGCDSVLKRMARRSMTEDIAHLIGRARAQVRNINITTDMIVGFPGETAEEWEESMEFIRHTGFSHIHIFTYSARPGTRAADLPDQVPLSIRKQRNRELHALARQMEYDFLTAQVGKQFPVLWESYRQEGNMRCYTGYTSNYVRAEVTVPARTDLGNRISQVTITGPARTGDMVYTRLC